MQHSQDHSLLNSEVPTMAMKFGDRLEPAWVILA